MNNNERKKELISALDFGKIAGKKIQTVINSYKPPPPPTSYTKLPENLMYKEERASIASFFIPSIFINNLIKDEDLEWFAERMVRCKHGNTIRGVTASLWERYWLKRNEHPYKRTAILKKFLLTQKNPKHLDQLKRRNEMFVKRNVFTINSIFDNCGFHAYANSHWGIHWLNGKNNKDGTSTWSGSPYHYYEGQHQNVPGIQETRKYIEDYEDFIIDKLSSEFGNRTGFEPANEAAAGMGWHELRNDVLKEYNIPKWRCFASMLYDNFYKKQIYTMFTYSVHGIGNVTDYMIRKNLVPSGVKFIASADGEYPPRSALTWEKLVYTVLKDGQIGFESNLRPLLEKQFGKWVSVGSKEDWSLKSLNFHYAECIKRGWFKYLKEVNG